MSNIGLVFVDDGEVDRPVPVPVQVLVGVPREEEGEPNKVDTGESAIFLSSSPTCMAASPTCMAASPVCAMLLPCWSHTLSLNGFCRDSRDRCTPLSTVCYQAKPTVLVHVDDTVVCTMP